MSLHRLIEEFAKRACTCADPRDLFALTEAAARELRFQRVALIHGLWFRRPDSGLIRLDNYGEWANVFIERRYYLHDPATLACQRSSAAFSWHEIPHLLHLTKPQEHILREAQRHDLRSGLTLPIGVVGEPHGSCSFVTPASELPSRWYCRAATLIGAEAFREARRLFGFPSRIKEVPQLSARKLECLRLLAIGKTDPEIAIILGLAVSTVRSYMALLRRDFDVVSRTQLAIEALRFGLIGYDDAIP